jgi:single-strand DNA-binding protein
MDLNKAILIGNLGKDPVVSRTPSGAEVAHFSLATNYVWRDYKTKEKKEAVEFHAIVAWGATAKTVSQYLKKGDKVYIEGRLQTKKWTDKTGLVHYQTEVVVSNLIMLSGPAKGKKDEEVTAEDISVEEVSIEE